MGMRFLIILVSSALLIGQMVRIPLGSQGIQFIDIVTLLVLIQISFHYAIHSFKNTKMDHLPFVAYTIFFAWSFISVVYGLSHYSFGELSVSDLFGGLLAACRFLFPLLILAYVLNVKINSNSAIYNVHILYYAALLVVVFGIFQAIFIENFAIRFGPDYEWDVQGNRLVSVFLDPNLAASFTSGIVVFTFLLLNRKVGSRNLLLIGAFLSITASVLTLSRGGILGLIVGLFVYYLYNKDSIKLFRFSNFVTFFIVILLVNVITINVFDLEFMVESDRFGATNESALIRFNNYMALINIFLDNPLVGVGFNYTRTLYADYFFGFSGNYVDGGVLVLLSSLGIIGISLLFIALTIFKKAARLDMSLFGPFIAMFLVQSFATSTIFYPLIVCYFSVALGLTQRTLKPSLN